MEDEQAEGEESSRGFAERVLGRVVGSVVSPVVETVDVDEVVERIDVNQLVDRIDVDDVMERIDVDALVARIEVNELLDRIEVDRLMGRIDVNALLDRVEPDRLLDRVDVNALLDRVEPDRLLDRVDADRLLDRVDVNALLDRVEPDRLLDRVDADRLLDRVDVNAVVERTELGAIIARSTTGVFSELLDVARTQLMMVDQVVQGVPAQLLRGRAREVPHRPSGASSVESLQDLSLSQRAVALQQHAAGSVSRFLAFVMDQFVAGVLFGAGITLTAAALRVVVGVDIDPEADALPIAVVYGLWLFLYLAGSLAATGRTIGKAVLGLMVVQADGRKLRGWAPAIRTLAFPMSFLLFGLGLLVGLIRRDRRELHDLIAGTAVIYAWDAATAQVRAEASSDPG